MTNTSLHGFMKKLLIVCVLIGLVGLILLVWLVYVVRNDETLCMPDTVVLLPSPELANQGYQLVAKVAGSHDKVTFINLYKEGVQFNECGEASQTVISYDVYKDYEYIDDRSKPLAAKHFLVADGVVTVKHVPAETLEAASLLEIPIIVTNTPNN